MTLKGRHTVITGGGSGIGAAIATALAAEGATITLMGRRLQPLQKTAETLSGAATICCDITDPDAVTSAFETAASQHGPIDILINNAGAAPTAPFHKLSYNDWRAVLTLNLDGVFNCTSQAIPAMRERGWGRIVNIASTAALTGYRYVSAYCAAKHGVLGLTRALALETATLGITVNAVCPGFTDTDIIRNAVKNLVETTGRSEQQALAEFTGSNPQGRLIQPEEVAATVSWLCRPGSQSITGQAIAVAGGEVM